MKKDVTSEEKLLNLIRKKNPDDKKDKTKKPQGNPSVWTASAPGDAPDFSKILTRTLMVLCLGLIFYIGSHVFLFKPSEDQLLSETQDDQEAIAAAEEFLPEPKPFSEYAQTLDQRDIFMSAFQKAQTAAADPAQPEAAPSQPLFDLSQNFKLVGIILDNDPKAVVEDLKNQRTLFLSRGDQLEGAVLKEIREGKVIFVINDQPIEMVP